MAEPITLSATTVIAAAPAEVWAVLVDMDAWGAWAPFHARRPATLAVGRTFRASFLLRGRLRVPGLARLTIVDPDRSLWWRSDVGPLLTIEHGFDLAPHPVGAELRHAERFAGPLAPAALRLLGPDQPGLYARANEALRRHVEART